MIRVNLLAARQRSVAASGNARAAISLSDNQRATELVKRLFVLSILPVGLFVLERQLIPAKVIEREEAKKKMQDLKVFNSRRNETSQKIKSRKTEVEKYGTQLTALKNLSRSRFYDLKIIDRLQDIIPDNTWMTSIAIVKGKDAKAGSGAFQPGDYKLEIKLSTAFEDQIDKLFEAISRQTDYFEEVLPSMERVSRSDNPKVRDFGFSIRLKKELPALQSSDEAAKSSTAVPPLGTDPVNPAAAGGAKK